MIVSCVYEYGSCVYTSKALFPNWDAGTSVGQDEVSYILI